MRSNSSDEPTLCKHCGKKTPYDRTQMCDNCHEVLIRVKYLPLSVLSSILEDANIENGHYLNRKEG